HRSDDGPRIWMCRRAVTPEHSQSRAAILGRRTEVYLSGSRVSDSGVLARVIRRVAERYDSVAAVVDTRRVAWDVLYGAAGMARRESACGQVAPDALSARVGAAELVVWSA